MLRKLSSIFLTALLLCVPLPAQAAHSASLTIVDTVNGTGTTYNFYRAAGTCPVNGLGTLTWVKLTTTPISGLTYTDNSITVGAWCFYATAIVNGVESAPSNTAGGTAKPNTITFSVVIQ